MTSIDKCQEFVKDLLTFDAKIRHFLVNTKGASCVIKCVDCGTLGPEGSARGFLSDGEPLQITLCANRLRDKTEVRETLLHGKCFTLLK